MSECSRCGASITYCWSPVWMLQQIRLLGGDVEFGEEECFVSTEAEEELECPECEFLLPFRGMEKAVKFLRGAGDG